jgi:hypothetical protein
MNDGPTIRSYKDLLVWQQAMDLAASIHSLSQSWPRHEIYGLTSQVRRAAAAFQNFLKTAQGSLKEAETHLLIAERVRIASAGSIQPALTLSESLGELLQRLVGSLSRSAP